MAVHEVDQNPWNQFNAQLLVTSEDYREREKRMRDAARHFYVDGNNYELFVDVSVPLYQSTTNDDPDAGTLPKIAQTLCVPLSVLDLDEQLQSVLARLRQETQNILPQDQWSESHRRNLVLCSDRRSDVIRSTTIMDAEPQYFWHTYMYTNAENLAQRPRAIYGGLPGSQEAAPINTCPIAIHWQLV